VDVPDRTARAPRESFADLGPLRPIAVATAVLPTVGTIVVLTNLPALATALPAGPAGLGGLTLAIAVVVAAVLLPPSFAAFAAGYLASGPGMVGALLGIAAAAVLGQRGTWPLLGERIYAFMRPRPRVLGVQHFCRGPFGRCAWRVAALRLAVRLPFAVQSLLLSAARTPSAAVAAGSLLAALPMVLLAGGAGMTWQRYHTLRELPTPTGWCLLGAATAAMVLAAAQSRRAWAASLRDANYLGA